MSRTAVILRTHTAIYLQLTSTYVRWRKVSKELSESDRKAWRSSYPFKIKVNPASASSNGVLFCNTVYTRNSHSLAMTVLRVRNARTCGTHLEVSAYSVALSVALAVYRNRYSPLANSFVSPE